MATKKLSEKEMRRKGFLPPTALVTATNKYKSAVANSKKAKESLDKAYRHLVELSNSLNWTRPPVITSSEYKGLPKNIQEKYTLDKNVEEAFELKVYNLTSKA